MTAPITSVSRVLDLLEPPFEEAGDDWHEIVARADLGSSSQLVSRRRATGRSLLIPALAATVAVILVASALAASGLNPLSAFGSWFSGSPGQPAPAAAQQQFLAGNGRSWAAFPTGTKLRVLIRASVGGQRYVLYGFRSGDSLCLRLSAVSLGTNVQPACAPVSTLEHTSVPLLVVEGNGEALAFPERRSAEVSFGIVADGIRRVNVHAVDGTHRAWIGGNAYLWVENEPNTANHVLSLVATAQGGARTVIPVSVRRFGEFQTAPASQPGGPSQVQAVITHPAIGWLVHHRPVGLAPSQVTLSPFVRGQVSGFTRFVKPDPLSDIVVGVGEDRLYVGNGSGGGQFFSRGPLQVMTSGGGPTNSSDQFVTVAGVAADGVSKIRIFLGNGESQDAALKDNVFTALVPGQSAIRVVAYNSKGLVVGIQRAGFSSFAPVAPAAARDSLKPVLHISAANHATATLSVGRTVEYVPPMPARQVHGRLVKPQGPPVRCWRIAFSDGQAASACQQVVPTGPWLEIQGVQPVGRDVFIVGQSRAPVARVTLQFGDGDVISARPVGDIVIFAVPRSHLSPHRQRAVMVGYDARGKKIQQPAVFFRANS
jgi:hypothetical protein